MSPWLYRLLRLGVLFGALIGLRLLWKSYSNYRDKRDYAEQMRDAQAFLEASNPVRRRAGLWPITAAFSERSFTEDHRNPGPTALKLSDSSHYYQPRPVVKGVGYDSKRRQLLWEREIIPFTVLRPGDSSSYTLDRTFSYQAAQATAQGRNAWGIGAWTFKLTRYTAKTRHDFILTPAQADSVLRDWRARGARDSLAALTGNRQ